MSDFHRVFVYSEPQTDILLIGAELGPVRASVGIRAAEARDPAALEAAEAALRRYFASGTLPAAEAELRKFYRR